LVHLSLIVKGTRLCNLRCSYCHDWREGANQIMASHVVDQIIKSALDDEHYNLVEFIWHGGEPTVLPISFYEKAMTAQSNFRRPGQIVLNRIQTNGTQLTEAWIRFLRDKQFMVSISLDGPPQIHDTYRRYASGRPSFQDVAKGISLLRLNGIPFYVLMVIDEGALELGPEYIFDFFLKMGIKEYGLLAATPIIQPNASAGTPTKHYVSPKRMTDFLIRLYDYWKEHRDHTIKIRELEGLLQRLRGKSNFCTLEGTCFGHYYVIEPTGEVAHCELFQGDLRYNLGNILETNFSQLYNGSKMSGLIEQNRMQLKDMESCPEFNICNGWCPHERYLSLRHDPDYNINCCGLRGLITHIRNNMPI
jgi:uncharacterized protein